MKTIRDLARDGQEVTVKCDLEYDKKTRALYTVCDVYENMYDTRPVKRYKRKNTGRTSPRVHMNQIVKNLMNQGVEIFNIEFPLYDMR